MIRFSLQCAAGHGFESWFRDNAAYEAQREAGLIACPACSSIKVGKAIMAPHVARKDRPRGEPDGPEAPAGPGAAPPAAAAEILPPAPISPQDKALRQLVRELRRHVEETADNVGDRFADEALRIHHGEAPERQIFGSATPDDARMLIEEGVPVMPLPVLPDDRH